MVRFKSLKLIWDEWYLELIESYSFGIMVINGKRYESDVLVFPERVKDGWWRKEGHRLYVEDLIEVFNYKPTFEFLIVGTGYYGLMKVSPNVEKTLNSKGIRLIVKATKEAYKTFNKLSKSKKRVAGAFHLTC